MAKASDLIGKSGAGGLGPIPKPSSNALSAPADQGSKEASKTSKPARKEGKSAKSDAKGKRAGGGGGTTSPSVRPKV